MKKKNFLFIFFLLGIFVFVSCSQKAEESTKSVTVARSVDFDNLSTIESMKYDLYVSIKNEQITSLKPAYFMNFDVNAQRLTLNVDNDSHTINTKVILQSDGIYVKKNNEQDFSFSTYESIGSSITELLADTLESTDMSCLRYNSTVFSSLKNALLKKSIKYLFNERKLKLLEPDGSNITIKDYLTEIYQPDEIIQIDNNSYSIKMIDGSFTNIQIYNNTIGDIVRNETYDSVGTKIQEITILYENLDGYTLIPKKIEQCVNYQNVHSVMVYEYKNIVLIGADEQ